MSALKYFFMYSDQIPDGVGFAMFGPVHFLWLILLSLIGFCIYRRFGKKASEKQEHETGMLAWILVLMEFSRVLFLSIIGAMSIYELPLHLCNLASFIALADYFEKWKWTEQTLFSLCLPGAASALIFPDWTRYPPIHFITLNGFFIHAGIVLYILMRIRMGKIKPNIREIWRPLLFLLFTVPVIYVFDRIFNANYFFINVPSPGSPLELIANVMGVPGYLVGYALLVLMMMLLMYGIYALFSKFLPHRNR